jgi:hypothetical protein
MGRRSNPPDSQERARKARCNEVMAQSKALRDQLLLLHNENQDVMRGALSVSELGAAMIEISDDLNRRVAAILRNSSAFPREGRAVADCGSRRLRRDATRPLDCVKGND